MALAADVLGDEERAQDVYQTLKFRLVGRLPKKEWTLTDQELLSAITEIENGRSHMR